MVEIQKALNQNAVLVFDEGQAKVAIGKGIGVLLQSFPKNLF